MVQGIKKCLRETNILVTPTNTIYTVQEKMLNQDLKAPPQLEYSIPIMGEDLKET